MITEDKITKTYQKLLILAIVIVVVLISFIRFPTDDSLRHVGVAFGNFSTWGDVYPFSVFEEFKDYDPWFGYDISLTFIASFLKKLPISLLAMKFFLIKSISLIFSLFFFYLVIERSGLLSKISDKDSFVLVVIILISFLVFTFGRVIIARPFTFGTFFILYSINRKGFFRGTFSAVLLSFFYPYLSWFYIVPVAFAHLIKGDKKFAYGALIFLFLFLFIQPNSFWGFQIALFLSDLSRKAIDIKISEFNLTLLDYKFYCYFIVFLLFYRSFSKNSKRLNYTNILLLIYLLPAAKYIRYFLDIILPLFFVAYGKEIFKIWIEPYRKITFFWTNTIHDISQKFKLVVISKSIEKLKIFKFKNFNQKSSITPYISIIYLLFIVLVIYCNVNQFFFLRKYQDFLDPIPEGSLILTSFNLQYQTLYTRPDLRIIPSCEMGFSKEKISKEYVQFFNSGFITPLSHKVGVEYFLENKDIYINPKQGSSLELIRKNGNLKLWKILNTEKVTNISEKFRS